MTARKVTSISNSSTKQQHLTGNQRDAITKLLIIIIIIIIHSKWVCTRWQWYYKTQNNTHTQNNTKHIILQKQ
jgi:hypothetical protein